MYGIENTNSFKYILQEGWQINKIEKKQGEQSTEKFKHVIKGTRVYWIWRGCLIPARNKFSMQLMDFNSTSVIIYGFFRQFIIYCEKCKIIAVVAMIWERLRRRARNKMYEQEWPKPTCEWMTDNNII